MNTYQQKIEAKRERFACLATRKSELSSTLYKKANGMMQFIPFGQPILVGHHSEKRGRAFRARIGSNMERSIEEAKKADYYAEKAASYGTHGISSDDPEAISKIKAEVAALEADQTMMKAKNKESKGEKPFPGWQLTNNSANIRRLKKRIETLERLSKVEKAPVSGDGYRIEWNTDENRVMIHFDEIPSPETRTKLKGRGFKWSPTRSAWVRMASEAAWYQAQNIL